MESPEVGKEHDCYMNLTLDQHYFSYALSGMCFISLVVSIPAVGLAIHEYCVKNRLSNMRTERLLLYLVSGSCIVSFLGCFQWMGPLSFRSAIAKTMCSGMGYLLMVVFTFTIAITFFIGVHFLIQIVKPKIVSVPNDRIQVVAKRMEIAYLSLSLLAAFLLTPWPFLNQGFGYNLWVCWINTTKDDCTAVPLPTTEITVYYVAVLVVALFSFTIIILVHALTCFYRRNISKLYVWVFTIYLVSIMLNIVISLVVDFLHPDKVLSVINFIQTPVLGITTLTASITTLIAVVYQKFFRKRVNQRQLENYNRYNSFDENNIMSRFRKTSRESTTKWHPPRTSEVASTVIQGT